ncbi:MAG: tetratricopeptide repeat protein [bacterium]
MNATAEYARHEWTYRVKPSIQKGHVRRAGDFIIAESESNVLHFLNADTGKIHWRYAFTEASAVYQISPSEFIVRSGVLAHLFDTSSKERKWTYRLKSGFRVQSSEFSGNNVCGDTYLSDAGEVALRSGDCSYEVVSLRTGAFLKNENKLETGLNQLKNLFEESGVSTSDILDGLRWENGTLIKSSSPEWKFNGDAPLVKDVIPWQGKLMVLDEKGTLYFLKLENGEQSARIDLKEIIDMRFWDERREFINNYSEGRMFSAEKGFFITTHSGITRIKIVQFPKEISLKEDKKGSTEEWAIEKAIQLWEEKKYPDALARFQEASEIWKDSSRVRMFMGMAYAALNYLDDAIRELETAHRSDPENADIITNLSGNYTAKILSLNPSTASDEIEVLYKKIIELMPETKYAYVGLSELFFANGRYADAEVVLNDAVKNGFFGVDIYTLLLCAQYLQGNDIEALRTANRTLTIFPDAKNVHAIRGKIYCRGGRYKDCAAEMEKEFSAKGEGERSLFPSVISAGARFYHGSALGLAGKYKDGIKIIRDYLEGLSSGRKTEGGAGEEMLKQAESGYRISAVFAIVNFYYRLGDKKNSLKYLKMVEGESEQSLEVSSFHGYFLALNGQELDRAEKFTGKAADAVHENPIYLKNHAVVLWKQKKFKEAEEFFRRAIEIDEGTEFLHLEYGCTLLDAGRQKEGIDEIRREVKLNPELAAAREKLKSLGVSF